MRKWGGILLLALLTALVFQIWEGDRGRPILTDHPGFAVYKEKCQRCHGYHGNRDKASRIAQREVDLGAVAFRDTTDLAEILQIVARGKGKMKGFAGKLDSTDMARVSSYVRDLPEALEAGRSPRKR